MSVSRKPVLSDHVRRGKSLVPKLVDQFPLSFSSWVDDELPEVLWLALLNRTFGWKRGAALAVSLANAASAAAAAAPGVRWWGATSQYATLPPDAWEQIRSATRDDLDDVLAALMPLLANYPTFPMRGIAGPIAAAASAATDLLGGLARDVESLFDPRALPATQAQGNAVYVAFVTGLLTVSPGLALASFPELQRYPETELSMKWREA